MTMTKSYIIKIVFIIGEIRNHLLKMLLFLPASSDNSGNLHPHHHIALAPSDYDWEDNWNEPPSINDDASRPWAPENPDEEWHDDGGYSSAKGSVAIHDDSFRYYDPEADPDAVVPPMPGNHDDDDGPDNEESNEERANQKNYDYGNWEPPAHDITLG